MSDLNIIISAILDKPSLESIDSQLKAIKDKYTNSVISIKFDTDVVKTLQGFTTSMEKFQAATDAQKKIVSETKTVFKELDGSIKTVTEQFDTMGNRIEKTRIVHDASKKSIQEETQAINDQKKSVEELIAENQKFDQSVQTKNKFNGQGDPTGSVHTLGESGTANRLTINADKDGNVTSSQDVENELRNNQILITEEKRAASERESVLQEEQKIRAAINKAFLKDEEDRNNQFINLQKDNYKEYSKTVNDNIALDKAQTIASQQNSKYDDTIDNKKFDLETKIINMKRRFGDSIDTKGLDDLSAKIKTVDGTTVNATGALKNIGQEIDRFGATVKVSGSHLINFGEQLQYTATRMISFSLIGAPIAAFTSYFKDGIQYVMDYNKALTLISSTTNKTATEVQQIGKDYQQMGIQMGVASNDIAQGSIEFYRNRNLSNEQVKQDMQQVIEYARVSGTEIPASSKIVIAAMNTMKTSATNVTDVFTAVGDSVSSSANAIGTAFQYVGGEAESINIPFQKTAAYIGVISSVTKRSAEEIGTAIKSIYARAESLKTTGFNDDGQDKTQVAKALDSIGVKLFDSQGQFRNFGVVLDETGAKWQSLDTRHKQYISTILGGTYQASNFNILMQNYAETLKLTDIAMNSAGTTAQKFALVQEGVAAHTQRLSSTLQNLWSDSFKTNGIIGVVDSLTSLISALDSVVNKFGFLPTVVFAATTAMLAFKSSIVSNAVLGLFGESIKSVSLALAIYTGSTVTARIATIALQATITLGLSLAITGLVAGISSLIQHHQKLVEQQRQLEAQNQVIVTSWTTQKDKVNELVAEYDKLDGTKNRTVDQDKRYLDVSDQLSKLMPNLIASIDAKGVAHLKSADAIAKELGYAEKLTKLENEKALTSAKKDFGNDVSDLNDAQKSLDRINNQIKYKNKNGKYGTGIDALSEDDIKSLEIQALGLESQINGSVDSMRGRVLSLSTTVATLAGVKVGDSVSAELKKITDSLNVEGLNPTQLAAKSNEIGKLIVTLDNLKNVSSLVEAQRLDKSFLDQAKSAGLSSDAIKGLLDSILKGNNIVPEVTKQTIDYTESIKKLDTEISDADKSISSLSSAYQKLQNGEQLSVDETLKLVEAHPQLLDYLLQHNGLITDKGAILQQVANIERQARLDEAKGLLDSVTDTFNALESKRKMYQDFYTKVMAGSPLLDSGLFGFGKNTTGLNKDGKVDFSSSGQQFLSSQDEAILKESEKNMKELQLRVDLLSQPIDLSKINKGGSSTDTTASETKRDMDVFARANRDLDNQIVLSEDHMANLTDTSKEYRAELQKQIPIYEAKQKLASSEADSLREANVELKNKLATEKLSTSQQNAILNQIDANETAISKLSHSWFEYGKSATETNQKITDSLDKQSKDRYDNSKKWIDAEAKQNELAGKDKMSVLQAKLVSEERSAAYKDLNANDQASADADVVATKIALDNEYYTHYSKLIDDKKSLDQLSIEDEINEYKKLGAHYADGADERIKADQKVHDAQKALLDKTKKDFETNIKAIQVIEDANHKQIIDNLDAEKTKFDDSVDSKIKALEDANFTDTFNSDQTDKLTQRAKLISDIASLSNATDLDSKNKKADLQLQLDQLNKDISNAVKARDLSVVKDSLQNTKSAYDKDVDAKKKAEDDKYQIIKDNLDAILNDETIWAELSKQVFDGNTTALSTSFTTLQTRLGTTLTLIGDGISTNLLTPLDDAKKKIDDLANSSKIDLSVNSGNINSNPSTTPTGSGIVPTNLSKSEIIAQMKANAAKALTASEAEKISLHTANEALGKQIDGVYYQPANGRWYYDNGFPLFHEGGEVGVKTSFGDKLHKILNQGEIPAILKQGEFVVKNPMEAMGNMLKAITPNFNNIIPKNDSNRNDSTPNITIGTMFNVDNMDANFNIDNMAEKFINKMESLTGMKIRTSN